MSKVLYIKANAKPEGESRTFRISDRFIERYRETHPADDIITLDLYKEGIDFLAAGDMQAVFGPKTYESRKHPILNTHISLRKRINMSLPSRSGT